ncbi:MAG: hypothetical protein KDJ37_14135 [Hyphomicrobiaceae bacterium]|nr:hypothetical protein [Hyphomicrobiaceae bacterium]
MAEDLFSPGWMTRFRDAWNREPELVETLARIGFDSVIGYGFRGETSPRGILIVKNGIVEVARAYDGEPLDWDLRADRETWLDWFRSPPGMISIGMAFTASRLQFVVGDYAAMIKDPLMAAPFMKSFAVMARV